MMNKLWIFIASCILTIGINVSAFADDLEIYLGSGDTTSTYNPNVIFIMDTSGSMQTTDSEGVSRIVRVQQALRDALASATNVNAGLMRFSDIGGPILYPVSHLDQTVLPDLTYNLLERSHDVTQTGTRLTTNDRGLELTDGTATVHTGLRYVKLMVPAGATITDASITFTSKGYNTAPSELTIFAEKALQPDDFSGPLLTDRTPTTSTVNWNSNNEFGVSGESIVSADISAVLQEVIDQPGWCGGNSVNFIIRGTSSDPASNREARSFEDGWGFPQLSFSYDPDTANGCIRDELEYQVASQKGNAEEDLVGRGSTGNKLNFSDINSYIGLRFEDINIPQGSTINDAYLVFTASDDSASRRRNPPASLNIYGVAEDNVAEYHPHRQGMLRDLPRTSPVLWDMPEFKRNQQVISVSVKDIVQAIVNRSGWQASNALGFILADFLGEREAYSYKGQPSNAPRLYLDYSGSGGASSSTVRDLLLTKVNELTANGMTPIVDTLYEASLYYGGLNVDYGLRRGDSRVSSTVRRETRVSHNESYTGSAPVRASGCTDSDLSDSSCITEYIPQPAVYNSPITNQQCQTNNHIVLLSDGEANNNHSVAKIRSILGSCSGRGGEECGLSLVSNLSNGNDSYIGSKVTTHTIGFAANATANNFLNQLAIQGGGGFYTADDSTSLLDAFNSIINNVKDVNTSFVSPGIAVNQYNRLKHDDELYFALFRPDEGTDWDGNLKKYRLAGSTIVDQNGMSAVDSDTGFFSDYAHSYWSLNTDGNDVREGGAASRLYANRNLYVFDSPGTITSTANRMHESNTNITITDLAVGADSDPAGMRELLLQWARGVDVHDEDADGSYTDVRYQLGDPIHAQPVLVDYSATQRVLFMATNQGYLHAIDVSNGEELWGVMPRSLLPNLLDIYNNSSTFNHIYGLDGHLVVRSDNGRFYLYVGMRRGGNQYFAFDITTPTSPSLMFTIDGDSADFAQLGQTWSKPIITKMEFNGTVRNVMVFAGGYDDAQDNKSDRTADSMGNAVFIVDADTGALLWKASNANANLVVPEMDYSIPGRVALLDRDADGVADTFYVIDIMGQVFRFDNYSSGIGYHLLADLGGSTGNQLRRFYYGVDVTRVIDNNAAYYAVVAGSGFRASPLESSIQDKVFMLKDKGAFKIESDGTYAGVSTTVTPALMYDATQQLTTSTDSTERELNLSALYAAPGWKMDLSTAEKVLTEMQIVNNKILFTTYIPASMSANECTPPSGSNRAYLIALTDAASVIDQDGDGELEADERSVDLSQNGIAPQPKIIINDMVEPTVCIGAECAEISTEPAPCNGRLECLADAILDEMPRVMENGWRSDWERKQ